MSKIFVLDTSVLLYDHNALTHFEDNDVVIPIPVLEELDNFKIGSETKNYEAREVIRFLDALSEESGLSDWIPLGEGRGKLIVGVMNGVEIPVNAETVYGKGKNDHKIINIALTYREKYPRREITLVTKDINLRIKSKALGLNTADYLTGKVQNLDHIENGCPVISDLDAQIIQDLYHKKTIDENGILLDKKKSNGYYILNNCTQSALARYNGKTDQLERVEKQYAFGIKPKNAEQTFAMDALLNPDIKLIALEGVAGSGKTLLALAAALEQKNIYRQIILSRPIVPLSNRDIGFLPGDANDKISPYMQPLFDNLKLIKSQYKQNEKKGKVIESLQEKGELEITALTFIRGRSLSEVYFIIDEAQNLTPHEMKTVITRAGDGTKIIFTGDNNQIDTPYLDERSNGLSYIIDKFKGHPLFAHIKLPKGERSELANLANELL